MSRFCPSVNVFFSSSHLTVRSSVLAGSSKAHQNANLSLPSKESPNRSKQGLWNRQYQPPSWLQYRLPMGLMPPPSQGLSMVHSWKGGGQGVLDLFNDYTYTNDIYKSSFVDENAYRQLHLSNLNVHQYLNQNSVFLK